MRQFLKLVEKHNLKQAKKLWLEAARAEGKPVPPPEYRPVIYQVASA